MPQLDFAMICDYVRADGGVASALAGGIDSIYMAETPAAHNMGVWARILLARNECGREHRFELFIQDEDGERVVDVSGTFHGDWPEGHPPSWNVGVGIALNMGVPLPHYGLYAVELMVNDSLVKSIPFRVAPIPDS